MRYKVGIRTYIIEELKWKQHKKMMRMIDKLRSHTDLLEEDFKMGELFSMLAKHNLLEHFCAFIMKRSPLTWLIDIFTFNWKKVNLSAASGSQIMEMRDDFFLCNKTLVTTFQKLGGAFALIANTIVTAQEMTKTKTSPSTQKKETAS